MIYRIIIKDYKYEFYKNFIQVQKRLNLNFYYKIHFKIKIAIYAYSIKNGGRARITSLLLNYFNTIKILEIFLFTKKKKKINEYLIPNNIKRIHITNNLINEIKKKKIDILVYQLCIPSEIKILNNLSKIKIIFYQHLGIFDWIYENYSIFKSLYGEYINSKYIINIIPFENDYLFKAWGIKSILMNNFITYNFSKIIPSDLSYNRILMIGRGDAKKKRFRIGIQSLEYIIQDIPNCELLIISDLNGIFHLKNLMNNINIEKNIKFVGYSSTPEIFYKNVSLNIFPSISEAFPLVICETKIYGIPNVLLGLDYTAISEGGTIIIYDETPESLAKSSLALLISYHLRKNIGIKARNIMQKYNNNILLIKWTKLLLLILNSENDYDKMRQYEGKISELKALKIINSQIILLIKRDANFRNIKINDIKNFTIMKNIK